MADVGRRGGKDRISFYERKRHFQTGAPGPLGADQCSGASIDMDTPVKIIDLARDLIRLSDLKPYKDIPIVYTGLRFGEKLYEELLGSNEQLEQTGVDGTGSLPRLPAASIDLRSRRSGTI